MSSAIRQADRELKDYWYAIFDGRVEGDPQILGRLLNRMIRIRVQEWTKA